MSATTPGLAPISTRRRLSDRFARGVLLALTLIALVPLVLIVYELLRKGRTTVGDAERAAIYKEAQRIIADEAPWIFIDHGRQIIIHRKRVQDFKLHPNFDLVLTQVWLQ